MKIEFNMFINLTWSKIMALVVLGCATTLDILSVSNGAFLASLPVIVILITGKQLIDWKENNGKPK